MAGRFRWYLARLEQTPSGHWRIKPDVSLPQGTHLRYWHAPGRPDIALVRVWHANTVALDDIESRAALVDWVKRIPLDKSWGQVKDTAAVTWLRNQWPALDRIPGGWSLDRVVDELIERIEGRTERRTATLPYMGDQPVEE